MAVKYTPRERDIERACTRHAESLGIVSRKLRPPPAGWPDRVFVLPAGVSWWVEFKRPGSGRLSPLQKAILDALGGAGHAWDVIDNIGDFKSRLKFRLTGKLGPVYKTPSRRRKTPDEVEAPTVSTRSRQARAR